MYRFFKGSFCSCYNFCLVRSKLCVFWIYGFWFSLIGHDSPILLLLTLLVNIVYAGRIIFAMCRELRCGLFISSSSTSHRFFLIGWGTSSVSNFVAAVMGRGEYIEIYAHAKSA